MHTLSVFLESPVSCFRPSEAQIARLAARMGAGWRVVCARTESEFLSSLPRADAAIVWTFRQEWFAAAPALRDLCTPAAGRDYFKVAPPAGVTLRYGTFHGAIMGETATACVLALSHGLFAGVSLMTARAGSAPEVWPRSAIDSVSCRLAGRKCAILGFGSIGQAAGKMLKSFGVRIAGISRSPKPAPAWFTAGDATFTAGEMAEALRDASFLLCFLPSGRETDRIVDSSLLALLPKGAYLLNFGRGNAVDEDALVAALRSGALGGAVLDVYREEPLPASSPLRTAPDIWLFPHSSAFSHDYLDLYFDEISAILAGEHRR
ncbi:MAG: hypothetical protein IJS46_01060 [Kiritimatiellae bacterium]|nr:hypothetical protein [Kiritimatiellia bacterium]